MPVPEGQEPRAGKLLQLRCLAGWFESGCFPMTISQSHDAPGS
jgi:hypothetical protein